MDNRSTEREQQGGDRKEIQEIQTNLSRHTGGWMAEPTWVLGDRPVKEIVFTAAEIAGMTDDEMDAAVQLNMVPLTVFSLRQRESFYERHPHGNMQKVTKERALAGKALLEASVDRYA